MNPLFMMFNPLGFFGGGCGCGFGVNMPYYGQNDMCTFMNFPVFRNTSNDYLLDPRLAMMQTQQSWMNGGGMGFFGNSYLPLFNNFPGMNMPGMNMPGMNNTPWSPWGPQRTETEEEKKQREAREKEDKDPKNVEKKARLESYKEYLNKFKATLSDDKKKEFAVIETKFKEALKEVKVEDRLKKVEELFRETFNKKSLTKIALADKDIDSKLYKAGYNFPQKISAHKKSTVESQIEEKVTNLNLSNSTEVGEFANIAKASKDYILPIISTFNSTHTEKGILRGLANNLPNDDTHQQHYKACIESVTNSLTAKAISFMSDNGGTAAYPKLSEQIKKVNKKLEPIQKVNYQAQSNNRVNAGDVNALANEFDKLYAMVRVLEAKVLNKKVVDKYAENMNNLIEGSIPEDIIIKETLEDLAAEKITAPTEAELDEISEQESDFRVSREKTSMEEIAEIEDANERMQALVEGKNKKLKAVTGQEGVYETRTEKEETNAPKRYYIVLDHGIAEAKLDSDENEYVVIEGKENVSAVEIGQYTDTVQNIDRYYRAGKIIKSRYVDGVYLSAAVRPNGHSEHFIIRNNKLVKVKGYIDKDGNVKLDNGTTTTIDKLTDADVTEVTSESDIYTKPAGNDGAEERNEEEGKEENKIENWNDLGIKSISDLNRKNLKKLALETTGVDGYYKYTGKGGGYYKYNADDNKLEKLDGVKEIKTDGTYIDKNGKLQLCKQCGKPEDFAKSLRKALHWITSPAEELIALRSLHTFLCYDDVDDIVAYIKTYEDERAFYENKMCKQIATENGVFTDELKRDGEKYSEYRRYFIHEIAKQLLKVADDVNVSDNDYKTLEKIAGGELVEEIKSCGTYSYIQESTKETAVQLDEIMIRIIKAYDEKKGTNQSSESED